MEFRVLGPLEVLRDGLPGDIRGSKRRALLALLVLHANEVVRNDRLIDELWGERPPANASAALQNHVSRLRKELGSEVLVTKPWGYVLRAEPGEVDLQRFEELVAEAKALPARERQAKLVEALALWRGPALADLGDEDALAIERARLDELRLAALEQRIDADLELGSHDQLVPELEGLVGAHPLRERLRGQLILALYRAGRQAEALETYRETRRVLVEELGIEPSPELKELERAILRQDPALVSTPPPRAAREEVPPARWRWPRSPLAIGTSLVLLAGAGAVGALVVPGGAGSQNIGPLRTVGALYSLPLPTQTVTETSKGQTTKQGHPAGHGRTTTAEELTTVLVTTQSRTSTQGPPSHPKPPQAKWIYLLADGFDAPALDPTRWAFLTNNDGVTGTQQNGRLELSVDPTAIPQDLSFDAHYATQCELSGNFDASVKFQLLDWPARNGINVYLAPWFRGAPYPTFIGRTGAAAAGGYPFEAYTTGIREYGNGLPTSDTAGVLRAKRVGGVVTTYFRDQNRWISLGSRNAPGSILLLIGMNANAGEFGRQAAAVAFDDFEATAESVDCHGFPVPPRKRVRQ
jgi:DNA-binding SARP family transcriptional activator